MGLSGSYSLGATGVLAGVTASAAASGGVACPFLRLLLGRPLFCAATVTPAGAGVLPAAPAAGPGVSGDQRRQGMPALAGVAVGRLVLGPMVVLRALQRRVSFFCVLFASPGEALSLFHRFVCG